MDVIFLVWTDTKESQNSSSRASMTYTHANLRQIFQEIESIPTPRLTVDREIFMLKIIRIKNFRVDKFSWFRSILEIFLRKMFYSRVKFSRLVSTAKLF